MDDTLHSQKLTIAQEHLSEGRLETKADSSRLLSTIVSAPL